MAKQATAPKADQTSWRVTLEDMLGFHGVRPVATFASSRDVRIGVGYSWQVDEGVPSWCLRPPADVARPGYYLVLKGARPSGAARPSGTRDRRDFRPRPRVAEILQQLVETSRPTKVSSAEVESSDQTPDERGAKLLEYRHDFRRLTAEPPGQLLESIASKMAECDLFIFDLTDYGRFAEQRTGRVAPNSNVLLEVGIAFGMNITLRRLKLPPIPVILVQLDQYVRQPSDLAGISVFRYRLRYPTVGSESGCGGFVLEYPCALRNALREAIRAAVLKRSKGGAK